MASLFLDRRDRRRRSILDSIDRSTRFVGRPLLPTIPDIVSIVEEEFHNLNLKTVERVDDGVRSYMRSLGSLTEDIWRGDACKGGVAMKVVDEEIWICLYMFRLVCTNGALMPTTLYGHRITRVDFDAPVDLIADVICALRNAVHDCGREELFFDAIQQVRAAATSSAKPAVQLIERLPGIPLHQQTRIRREIADRLTREQDRSLFGVMNAVTSVARDETDPEMLWRLEELGGSVPLLTGSNGICPTGS